MKLRIATRKSPLALWQAHHVASLLRQVEPSAEVSLVELITQGDRFLQAPLAQVGGKGLFVKEIEQAILEGRAELAVHSLKDMTSLVPDGLVIATVPAREDPRDAFVSPVGANWTTLRQGARVGTSSLRRACQLKERRPDLEIVNVRGNVQTRLKKMAELGLDGGILALAGLKRLGLEAQVRGVLSLEESLPAVGQGVLAVQCRTDDVGLLQVLARLEDHPTRVAITAERALMRVLEGGCTVPLAGYAMVDGEQVWLRGLLGTPDGARVLRAERRGRASEAEALGRAVGEALLAHGGRDILAAFGRRGVEATPES